MAAYVAQDSFDCLFIADSNAAPDDKVARDKRLYGLASCAYKTWNGETATRANAVHAPTDDANNCRQSQYREGNINRLITAGRDFVAEGEFPNHSAHHRAIIK